jgi:hypothetical protein
VPTVLAERQERFENVTCVKHARIHPEEEKISHTLIEN